jgi:prepilin-type N-terminal cleavage/methylation domain-containing protein
MTPHHFLHSRGIGNGGAPQRCIVLREKRGRIKSGAGFTLIEMMVSVTLFAVVMLVSVGALLALTNANRKAQALQSVMNNLSVSVDGMVRAIREGSTYHCDNPITPSTIYQPKTCANGDQLIAFESYGGDSSDPSDQWIYYFGNDNRIYKSTNGQIGSGYAYPVTAPEVKINDLEFYVVGTTPVHLSPDPDNPDLIQPKVVIVIKGTAGNAASERSSFHIQATAVQRHLDL